MSPKPGPSKISNLKFYINAGRTWELLSKLSFVSLMKSSTVPSRRWLWYKDWIWRHGLYAFRAHGLLGREDGIESFPLRVIERADDVPFREETKVARQIDGDAQFLEFGGDHLRLIFIAHCSEGVLITGNRVGAGLAFGGINQTLRT